MKLLRRFQEEDRDFSSLILVITHITVEILKEKKKEKKEFQLWLRGS